MEEPATAESPMLQSVAALLQSTPNTATREFMLQFRREHALQWRPSLSVRFQNEMEETSQLPLTLATLQDSLLQSASKKTRHATSWSSLMETTARCVHALYKAPPEETPTIVSKLTHCVRSLTTKVSAQCSTDEFVSLLYQFMETRALRMACLSLLDRGLVTDPDDSFWHMQTTSERAATVNILNESLDSIASQSERLRQHLLEFRAAPLAAPNVCHEYL